MQSCDLAPAYIKAISPYLPGKPIAELARELGIDESKIIKLASNENPLGASPRAMTAMANALADLSRYPDGSGFELRAALTRRFGVEPGQIVLGNGSNEVLDMVAAAFLSPGVKAVYSAHAFAVYPLATQAKGATGIEVAALDFAHDLHAMRTAIDEDTRVVFVANPNNPTGTLIEPKALKKFVESVPVEVVIVLDEAYNEYLPRDVQANTVEWIARHPNLIITRTFSKAYGLAGLRVGYGLMSASVAELLNRVRPPFNVNSVAQVAAAAALGDIEFVRRSFELNQAGMRQLTQAFGRLGLAYIPSYGNFVAVEVGDAVAVNAKLLKQGVIVRPVANYGMPRHLRITVGLAEENERFLAALRQAL